MVSECAQHSHPAPVSPQVDYITEDLDLASKGLMSNSQAALTFNSVTLVTQVSMDRLAVLEKTLQTWTSPVSLAVYVPVKDMAEGLVEWQR